MKREPIDKEAVGARIAELRKNITQEEFGKPYGLSRQAISKWENGETFRSFRPTRTYA